MVLKYNIEIDNYSIFLKKDDITKAKIVGNNIIILSDINEKKLLENGRKIIENMQ